MEHDKLHSIANTSNDITTRTKQGSAMSITNDDVNNKMLNLSNISYLTEKKFTNMLISNPLPLKRSKSHKRHHFKVEIGNIVNEELNEDDTEQIMYDNDDELSPETKLLVMNLIDENKKISYHEFSNFLRDDDDDDEKLVEELNNFNLCDDKLKIDNFGINDDDSEDEDDVINFNNSIENKDKLHTIPTILNRILKQEALQQKLQLQNDDINQ